MGIHIQIAEVEAEDNSYRYTGLDWDLTSKAGSYDRVYDTSTYTNGLIKFYCSQGDDYSYIGANCKFFI